MFVRKFITSLALAAACITPGIAAATSAHAAENPHVSSTVSTRFVAADCDIINHQGSLSTVALTICGVNATAIGALTGVGFYGHFQFLGPRGFNENSPGGDRENPAQQGGAIEIDPPRLAAAGSVWCVRLWQYVSPGNYKLLDDNCVTVP